MDSNRPTETKRAKISKAQRVTLVEVLAASLVLGACPLGKQAGWPVGCRDPPISDVLGSGIAVMCHHA